MRNPRRYTGRHHWRAYWTSISPAAGIRATSTFKTTSPWSIRVGRIRPGRAISVNVGETGAVPDTRRPTDRIRPLLRGRAATHTRPRTEGPPGRLRIFPLRRIPAPCLRGVTVTVHPESCAGISTRRCQYRSLVTRSGWLASGGSSGYDQRTRTCVSPDGHTQPTWTVVPERWQLAWWTPSKTSAVTAVPMTARSSRTVTMARRWRPLLGREISHPISEPGALVWVCQQTVPSEPTVAADRSVSGAGTAEEMSITATLPAPGDFH